MFRGSKYVKQVIDAKQMLADFGNTFMVVSGKPFKGKPESGLAAGSSFTLQVMKDDSAPTYNKQGELIENNLFETFDVTIPGLAYPSDIKKGDKVRLGNFMPEVSYYIDFKLILRFDGITKLQSKPQMPSAGGMNGTR